MYKVQSASTGLTSETGRMSSELNSVHRLFGIREFTLALFLLAGYLKGNPLFNALPFDITIASAALVYVFVLFDFARRGQKVSSLLLIFAAYLIWLPALGETKWNEYSSDKALRFFLLTLPALVASVFLIRTNQNVKRLLNAIVLISFLVCLNGLIILLTSNFVIYRLGVTTNPIQLGRASGYLILWSTSYLLLIRSNRRTVLFLTAVLALALIVLLAAGSRGPIFSLPVAFLLVLYFLLRKNKRAGILIKRLVFVIMLLFAGAALVRPEEFVPETALSRVFDFNSETDASVIARGSAYRVAWELTFQHPEGIGFDGYQRYGVSPGGDGLRYPHNIFLELFLDGGWLVGISFIILITFLFWRSYKIAFHSEQIVYVIAFILLIYEFLNSMLSNDLNGYKTLLALMALFWQVEVTSEAN